MLHFTFQNMKAFYGPWPRGLGLKEIYSMVRWIKKTEQLQQITPSKTIVAHGCNRSLQTKPLPRGCNRSLQTKPLPRGCNTSFQTKILPRGCNRSFRTNHCHVAATDHSKTKPLPRGCNRPFQTKPLWPHGCNKSFQTKPLTRGCIR